MDDKIARIWDLCGQLTAAIEDAVKDGYRVGVSLEKYRMFGWRDEFSIVQASVYKGVAASDRGVPGTATSWSCIK